MGHNNINLNIFNFNSIGGQQQDLFAGLSGTAFRDVNQILSDIFSDFAQLFDSLGGNQFSGCDQGIAAGGCTSPPLPSDGSHPSGSLQADGSVVTTPGGYKIEALSQFEWQITGPDGKTTRVWGDPHVAEGDGGKWDFKRNSTFVLGDGTRINVSTAPHGNSGMTVTSGLEIISGNDRVTVSGIDKGKGVVGQVTQDGYAHSNTFGGNDVFVMGSESDDWSYQGKEVIGSNNGGESFKLGNNLAAGNVNGNGLWQGNNEYDFMQIIRDFVNELIGGNNWNNNARPNPYGSNPYYNGFNSRNDFRYDQRYDQGNHRKQLSEAFRLCGQMFNILSRLASMNDQMYTMRNRALYA